MRLLFIGDIFGKPGRQLLKPAVPRLVQQHEIDLVIANVENAAGGSGITPETGAEILAAGVAVMTSGNHVWDKREAIQYIGIEQRLIRPANYPRGVPGFGSCVVHTPSGDPVGVLNLMGRVFMLSIDDPFQAALAEIERLRAETSVIVVDFHAEATSEKIAMGWHLDGRCTAVLGTHTHVQTADARVLPGGTAYITDVGMTGPHDSIIGVEKSAALGRFLNAMPARFDAATGDPRLHAVIVTTEPATGRALTIERLSLTKAEIGGLT
ncbi:MAG: TIGR00282 family metallophosphoesterase [Luteitalea sp.]|nr:TIGR00282 family metallophosphoesterase [Luteitalea sp.]